MEVRDTSWKPLSDVQVAVVGDDGNEYYGEKTGKDGVLRDAGGFAYRFNQGPSRRTKTSSAPQAGGGAVTNGGRLVPSRHEVFSPRADPLEMNSAVMPLMQPEK